MTGCQIFLDHAKLEYADNTKTLEVARLRIPVTTSHIAFIKGNGRDVEFSVSINDAMDEYLVLTAEPNDMTDFELVYSLGISARIYEECLRGIVRYIP